MYNIVITTHAWVRWLILGIATFALIRAISAAKQPWASVDQRVMTTLVALIDIQLLLGLSLWLSLSPVVAIARANMKVAMKNSALRFFVVEHSTAMILALVAAHVTSVMIRRAADDAGKRRRFAWGVVITLICLLAGMPWPGLPYARPLFHI
jgi:hypothetical protein